MVLNKSIKHQMFLKYNFQPHDMIFDIDSIIITIQNANSTSDGPVSASEKLLFRAYAWIGKGEKKIQNRNSLKIK